MGRHLCQNEFFLRHLEILRCIYKYRGRYVTRYGKRDHLSQKNFLELYISRECTMRALRDDANCSKIAFSSYTRRYANYAKRTNSRFPVGN